MNPILADAIFNLYKHNQEHISRMVNNERQRDKLAGPYIVVRVLSRVLRVNLICLQAK